MGLQARAAAPSNLVQPELVIYTYDSLVAEGGLGPKVFPIFQKLCGCKLTVQSSGDGEQIVGRLELDAQRKKPLAHVVLGLDEAAFQRAKPLLELDSVGFTPYDYGYFTFIADQVQLKSLGLSTPRRFADLLKPEWKRNLILEDPRTSTPGMAFLLYANQVAEKVDGLWESLRGQWLTLTPSWDAAYGLFLRHEAPLVWSYTTSQAYHQEHGQEDYAALNFEEGLPIQVEGAALVQGAFSQDARLHPLALSFLKFLKSPEVQSQIALTNWMYPIEKKTKLPPSFQNLPQPKKIIHLPQAKEEVELELSKWVNVVSKNSK